MSPGISQHPVVAAESRVVSHTLYLINDVEDEISPPDSTAREARPQRTFGALTDCFCEGIGVV